ncbi:carbohydrate ABC transporter permease [Bacillus sp. M6-12]|uniref:carbohydrate ABC transporter permease n=1 Tax=Bacillus sp. M6-12 TaxID=2054166 RepID=UPI000C77CCC1|nr:carbohydrate ABC transporter permease [Bacillus sp. M6-12]PLS18748.1 carbohydrate ABC transporter permease [Bacillus sp. M6-12]
MISNRISALSILGKLFLYLWTLFILFILGWIILASLKTNQELFKGFWSLPETLQWGNYYIAWVQSDLASYFFNSLLVVTVSVIGIVAVSAPAAYVLSRFNFFGKEFLTNAFVVGIGIPYQAVIIPIYLLLMKIGLINSFTGLIIVYIALSLPFTIFILTGFFQSLPSDVEEAAIIDGASENAIFWKIMLPMARPGLITVAILNAVGLWNEFLLAKAYINVNEKYTLSVGLYQFYQSMQYNSDWVSLFAGVVIVIFPILIFYLWLSDKIIAGMTAGSGK